MTALTALPLETLWRHAFAAIPLVLIVGVITRWLPCRPATRHTLWLTVLIWFLVAPLVPRAPVSPLSVVVKTASTNGAVPQEPAQDETNGSESLPSTSGGENVPPADRTRVDGAARSRPRFASARRETNAAPAGPASPFRLARATGPCGALFPFPLYPIAECQPSTTAGPQRSEIRTQPDRADGAISARRTGVDEWQFSPRETAIPVAEPLNDPRDWPQLALTELALPTAFMSDNALDPTPFPSHTPATSSNDSDHENNGADWSAWRASLLAIRDAVATVPPMPPTFWLGGAGLLLLIAGARVVALRSLLSRARVAPPSVHRMVQRVADEFGLARVPDAYMVDHRISPMVWSGRRLQVVLPAPLWAQLDEPGRRAVIYHELAHLRRRDHWVNWIELIVGTVYWWHPLVWWARHRLRTEAELCCDAWVTSLMPRGRRAYAEALLTAKACLREESRWMPTLGMGMTKGRAGRFARRITMVMTQSVKPRLSLSGMALAVSVAGLGWMTAPAQACPKNKEKDCDKAVAAAHPRVAVGAPCPKCKDGRTCDHGPKVRSVAPCSDCTPGEPCPHCRRAEGHAFFGRAIAPRDHVAVGPRPRLRSPMASGAVVGFGAPPAPLMGALMAAGGDEDDDRIERLERRLEEMARELERMARALHGERPPAPRPDRERMHKHKPGKPREPREPRRPREPRPPAPPRPAAPPRPDCDETITNVYHLPKGKLEALTNLMARDDVPILIRPLPDGIQVYGTPREQRIFRAFVDMIHPPKDGRSEAPGADRPWEVEGKAPMFHERVERMARRAERMAEQLQERAERDAGRHTREVLRGRMRALQHQRQSIERLMEQLQRQAEAMREQAERMREHADELREQADEIREKADELREETEEAADKDGRAAVEARVAALLAQATGVDSQSETLVAQAAGLDQQADLLERQAEAHEAEADALEDQIDELEEQAEADGSDDCDKEDKERQ